MLNRIRQYKSVLLSYYLPFWTRWFRCLPDFIIVGVQKGGTTSLYALLEKSTNVKMGRGKEIWYFDRYYYKGIDWYRLHFPLKLIRLFRPNIRIGEATPSYIFNPKALKRIKKDLPGVKLIIVLRDPVSRAFSHYKHMKRNGRETASSFENAVDLENSRLEKELEKILQEEFYFSQKREDFAYVEKGRYDEQIKSIYSFFDKSRVLIIKSDDLFRGDEPTIKNVFKFLEIERYPSIQFPKYNFDTSNKAIPSEVRDRLRMLFADSIAKLEQLTGQTFNWH